MRLLSSCFSTKQTWLCVSNVSFPSSMEIPSVIISVSQLFGWTPNNNKTNTSSARGMSRETLWLINLWNTFMCSTILDPSWYLNHTKTMFKAFLVSKCLWYQVKNDIMIHLKAKRNWYWWMFGACPHSYTSTSNHPRYR